MLISSFLTKSPGFLRIFLDPPGFDIGNVERSAREIYWMMHSALFKNIKQEMQLEA